MRIWMTPGEGEEGDRTTGISAVVHKYVEYLKKDHGVEFVQDNSADIIVGHAGVTRTTCDVAIIHGLYWTGDYKASRPEYVANANIVESVRAAREITVPSEWVQEVFKRDMHVSPTVIHHGIEAHEWAHKYKHEDYVLWNKNRQTDVCNPFAATKLAHMFPSVAFVSTFSSPNPPQNMKVIGKQSFDNMKLLVQKSGVYLSLVKETFGIGTLEAMASGCPVLGWRHGGNTVLVQHGVNGYLAEPDNYDDLAAGLEYCMKNRVVLGDNGIEIAKGFTWQNAVNKLYEVFERAAEPRKHTVSVIIPTYNYADKVGRAIESVCKQTYRPKEIVVVDDGSKDNPEPVVQEFRDTYKDIDFVYIRQENSGVAEARNNGVRTSTGEYVCCLDADDAIEPDFLRVCVEFLKDNPSVYTAYTRLRFIKPDGETGISPWPAEYDYDKFLQRQNQVPTCNVTRRVTWERLGGQRSRYAPIGAGSEDAEMWLRAGAYGMGAKLAGNKPLFIYSWLSGMVSGNPEYSEVDWLGMHPWAKDKLHPFASLASPANKVSHEVIQYDEPVISVVIPCAVGHEKLLVNALDSLEAQTFRKWEAVVVYDSVTPIEDVIQKAHPYAKFYTTTVNRKGPGAARNIGVENSRAKLLFFLDADDELVPECLEKFINVYVSTDNNIVYSDYVSVIPTKDDEITNKEKYSSRFVGYNKKLKQVAIRAQSLDYDCARAQEQPAQEPYEWCTICVLVPKKLHEMIGGFDETLKTIEDVDYHWRMTHNAVCYTRIREPLQVINTISGVHKETKRNHDQAITAIKNKYRSVKMSPCAGCGKKKTAPVMSAPSNINKTPALPAGNVLAMQDDNFVRAVYTSANIGMHQVVGAVTKIRYGYRKGGQIMLVHKKDMEVSPHLFKEIREDAKEPPNVPPKPEPIAR